MYPYVVLFVLETVIVGFTMTCGVPAAKVRDGNGKIRKMHCIEVQRRIERDRI